MKKLLPVLVVVLLVSASRLAAQPGSVTLHFVFQFQGKPLEAGRTYRTQAGEPVRFDQVRFYVGGPHIITTEDRSPDINSVKDFWLIDSKDTASLQITFPADTKRNPAGIGFRIGVDSANQVRGARTGALDPLKGMYWTWNSGYVAVKIEGHSPVAATPGGQFEYHLGGYRGPDAVGLPVELKMVDPFPISEGSTADLDVPIDLDRFFPATFSVKKMPAIMTPGPMAKQLMKQFESCFLPVVLRKPGA